MQKTIFNTPVVTPVLRLIARLLLRLHGWRVVCDRQALKLKKYVLIGAPHTSNWDGYYFILAALKLGLTPQWMGKDKLFSFPLGGPCAGSAASPWIAARPTIWYRPRWISLMSADP